MIQLQYMYSATVSTSLSTPTAPWLLLIHRIPSKPGYLRVKVSRRLHRIGAIPLKNSVYVLPNTPESLEDFQWLQREVEEGGGEATVCSASLLAGITEDEVKEMFRRERDGDYEEITRTIGEIDQDGLTQEEIERLRHRLDEIVALDFFDAPGRVGAEHALRALEARFRSTSERAAAPEFDPGRTWVTRQGVHVDRIASAWLIRRSIDPSAEFKFVPADGYEPQPGELRFDMFEGEFTHEGDRCTFEVLLAAFDLDDPALRAIGEVVHDIDLKDEKFGRPETAGIASVIRGIALAHPDDVQRLLFGGSVFDGLYSQFESRVG